MKLIATRSTGFGHIDLEYCQANDITVCNVPVYGDNTVAEHVFALLLAISHNMIAAVDRTRWRVIEIAKGFSMEVLAADVIPDEDLASRLGFRYVKMEELLASSDIITLPVPSNENTRNLISTDEFAVMKEGVVLINTARGAFQPRQAKGTA
ncbi:MAG: hypothetical protein K0B01_12865 [Syntrophobacterales bacterium]|nr:hypothetical protein [Syntrophobacterales bacterium]